jgi:hypothetical protein
MNEPYTRGLSLLRSGREREAVACLREAIALAPGDAPALNVHHSSPPQVWVESTVGFPG